MENVLQLEKKCHSTRTVMLNLFQHLMFKRFRNKFGMTGARAFTLAEVLITLTIIGVIAALTIPNLIKKYEELTILNRLKKVQSVLSNITTQIFNEYGYPPESFWTGYWGGGPCTGSNCVVSDSLKPELNNFIISKLKVKETCPTGWITYDTKCTLNYQKLKNLNGTFQINASQTYPVYCQKLVLTHDNMSYCIMHGDVAHYAARTWGAGPKWFGPGGESYGGFVWFWVDINGKQGPNTAGKDIFAFAITGARGVFPAGWSVDSYTPSGIGCNKNEKGYLCAGKFLKAGKVSYK